MRKNIENSPGPRRGAFLKRAARWALSLKWVDWLKKAHWVVEYLVPWLPAYVVVPLSRWVDLGQVNEALMLIA